MILEKVKQEPTKLTPKHTHNFVVIANEIDKKTKASTRLYYIIVEQIIDFKRNRNKSTPRSKKTKRKKQIVNISRQTEQEKVLKNAWIFFEGEKPHTQT